MGRETSAPVRGFLMVESFRLPVIVTVEAWAAVEIIIRNIIKDRVCLLMKGLLKDYILNYF